MEFKKKKKTIKNKKQKNTKTNKSQQPVLEIIFSKIFGVNQLPVMVSWGKKADRRQKPMSRQ